MLSLYVLTKSAAAELVADLNILDYMDDTVGYKVVYYKH